VDHRRGAAVTAEAPSQAALGLALLAGGARNPAQRRAQIVTPTDVGVNPGKSAPRFVAPMRLTRISASTSR